LRIFVAAFLFNGIHSRVFDVMATSKRDQPMLPTRRSGVGAEPFSEAELDALEAAHPEGLGVQQIVDTFVEKGERLTEATFRKYVQLGLLPRSRRVGRKGKHRGSQGLYPATAIRQLVHLRQLMGLGFTIEEIQREFLFVRGDIEALGRQMARVYAAFESAFKVKRSAADPADSVKRSAADPADSVKRSAADPADSVKKSAVDPADSVKKSAVDPADSVKKSTSNVGETLLVRQLEEAQAVGEDLLQKLEDMERRLTMNARMSRAAL
jgi:hypothetical protein